MNTVFNNSRSQAGCRQRLWLVLGCLTLFASREGAMAGTSRQVAQITPRCLCQNTGIQVQKDMIYHFDVSGTWTDWFVTCTERGPKWWFARCVMFPLRFGLRVPPSKLRGAHFLSLIGTLECVGDGHRPREPFLIRNGMVWKAPADGVLHAFANDWRIAYGNNRGCLTLAVSRVD